MATTAALTAPAPLSVEALLGGRRVLQIKPRSPLDWVEAIRRGIPAAAFESLLQVIRISQADMSTALGIPERTLARRKREGLFNSEESAKLVRLARVIERAEGVFENPMPRSTG